MLLLRKKRFKPSRRKFSNTYWKIWDIKTRFRVIKGGASAGKSYAVAQDEIIKALYSVQRTLVIKKVSSTIADSTFKNFTNRLDEMGLEYESWLRPYNIQLDNGSEFLFRGIDDPEKLKSIEGITRVVIEEATDLTVEDFKELNRRVRGVENVQYTLLFNPVDETHWIKGRFFDKEYDNVTTITVTYRDNYNTEGKCFITQADIDELEDLKNFDENQYNIYALAEWGKLKTGQEYFPHFIKHEIVRPVHYDPTQQHTNTAWDFNVVPYMSCLCGQVGYSTWYQDHMGNVFEEPGIGYTPIEMTIFYFYKEYAFRIPLNSVAAIGRQFEADHPDNPTMDYYGDSQGLNRVEGLGTQTRYDWVRDEFATFIHNGSEKVVNPNVAPLRRRDLVDGIFAGKYKNIRIFIDPSCVELIDDLVNCKQGVKGKIKKRVKNKVTGETYEEHGHMSDAMEDMVSEVCKDYIN